MGRRRMLIVATSYGTRKLLDSVIIISENDDLPIDTNSNGVTITVSARC